ncbi:MAG: right-handed parallel beta-helix repeat-containing protein [Candidatus Promineifilaceae bacterium]|nr:right-handed parallel beta-helix repeat-containing protein [Anaerolineaceae bacterium]
MQKSKRLLLLLTIWLGFVLVLAGAWRQLTAVAAPQAANRYVAPGGVDGSNDCTNPNNPCSSLMYAVQQTEAGDTVIVAAGFYTETDTINFFRDVTIQGAGLEQTIVSVPTDPNIWRVFLVYGGVNVSISHLTLRNADRSGILNIGNLTLDQVSIADNRGVLGGGGIYNESGAVITITDSLISNNGQGNDVAAGMLNFGQATIQRALVVGNKAGSYGGGLHNQGTLLLENVTFTLNEADSGTAVSNGGSGVITMTNVTIARNTNTQTNPSQASAISNFGTSIQASNSLIAENGPNQQCSGTTPLTSLGHNLNSHNDCNFNQPTDLLSADPLLDTFASVSGTPNWVSALTLANNSPALDAGSSTTCPATDARGLPRPVDGNLDGTAVCDIGAYEAQRFGAFLPMIVR